jgi:hypothetical protein
VLGKIHRDFMRFMIKTDHMVHCFQEDRGVLGILGLSHKVVKYESQGPGALGRYARLSLQST